MATIFLDHFTDANGTNLTAHTPDVGSGWSVYAGTFDIQGNRCDMATNTSDTDCYVYVAAHDYTLTCTVNPAASTALVGVNFRRFTHDDCWWWVIQPGAPGVGILYKRTSGSFTNVGSASFTVTAGTDYVLQVVLSGSSIICTVDGSNTVSVTDSYLATQLVCGLAAYDTRTSTWDNFTVDDGTGGASFSADGSGEIVLSGSAGVVRSLRGSGACNVLVTTSGTGHRRIHGSGTCSIAVVCDGSAVAEMVGTGQSVVFVNAGEVGTGTCLVVTHAGLRAMLSAFAIDGAYTVHLYVSDTTPYMDSLASDFTELYQCPYTPAVITAWESPEVDDDGDVSVTADPIEWTLEPSAPFDITGFYATDSDGNVVFAQQFDTPVTIPGPSTLFSLGITIATDWNCDI